MNLVVLSGRLGKDPELTKTSSGISVCRVYVAVIEGGQSEDTPANWQNLTLWREQAERLCEYAQKGDTITVKGSIKTDTWEKDGQTHYKTYVNVDWLEFGRKSTGGNNSVGTKSTKLKEMKQEDYKIDEDLPF